MAARVLEFLADLLLEFPFHHGARGFTGSIARQLGVGSVVAGDVFAGGVHGLRGQFDFEGREAIGKWFDLDVHGIKEASGGI